MIPSLLSVLDLCLRLLHGCENNKPTRGSRRVSRTKEENALGSLDARLTLLDIQPMQIDRSRRRIRVVLVVDPISSLRTKIPTTSNQRARQFESKGRRERELSSSETHLLINLLFPPLMRLPLLTQLMSGSSVPSRVGLLGLLEAAAAENKRTETISSSLFFPLSFPLSSSHPPIPSPPQPYPKQNPRCTHSLIESPSFLARSLISMYFAFDWLTMFGS